VSDERRDDGDYRSVRQASAALCIGTVVVIVLADSLGIGRDVDPAVLYGLLLTAAGLLAVDLPGLHR